MEAQRQQLGGIFPGYSGPALRRAMRSSRVRAKSSVHDSKCEDGTGCFELLAAVAGQFLQDSGSDANHYFTKKSECDIPNYQSYDGGNELVAECNREPTFGADQSEKKECRAEKILCSSQSSPLISKVDVEEEVQVQKKILSKDSVQYNPVFGKPLASKSSQNQALISMTGYHKYLVKDALPQGCTTEWEETTDQTPPIAVNEDDGFSAKSDNESGTASVDCKEKSALQRQSGGRGNLSLNLGKQEPCRVNQVAHEYSLKDHDKQAELRILSEDVLSNEMMLEQEGDFEEECSRLKRLDYEPSDRIVVQDIQAIEETERENCFSKFEQREGFPSKGSNKFSSKFVHVNKEKDNALLAHYGITSKCPNSFFRMENEKINASPLRASLVLKDQMQRLPNNEKNDLVFCSFVHEKASPLEQEVSDCMISKVRAKKCTMLRCKNSFEQINCHGGSVSCSKRKYVDLAYPIVTDGMFKKEPLYGETASTKQRSSRVSKFRRNRTFEKEDKLPNGLPLHHNDVQGSKYQRVDGEPPAAAAKLRRAKAVSVASSPTESEAFPAIKSSESHIKVSIKSFTVPELLVDLPESATVADLKKAVMDAAMNILGGGLRVRVLMQGKKVPDEGATLSQLGISMTGKPESLGFMLEPTPTSTVSSNFEDPLLLLSHAASQPSPRYATFQHQGVGKEEKGGWPYTRKFSDTNGSSDLTVSAMIPNSDETNFEDTTLIDNEVGDNDNCSEGHNNRELEVAANQRPPLGLQSKDATIGAMVALRGQRDSLFWPKHESDSTSTLSEVTPLSANDGGAIILHPRESSQQMAIVSMQQNNLLQAGKRRIRRPFSVLEVEALVLAVEKLGTGRWRDIKAMAFDEANYRTYVDLKDKWKTLVHTAQIAPHKRRGEPVPQDLLDRVLHASSYWTAQQAKQQAEIHS